jgi:general secretion pathway protein H
MRQQQGFTLIEIMIVVFVIGISVGMVSFSIGGNSDAELTRKETEEFMLQADYIAEQSVLKGETHGLFVVERNPQEINFDAGQEWCYQWRRVRDRQWQDLPELQQRCLPEGMKIDFVIDDKLWKYDPELEYQDPVMGFFPSGDGSGEVEISIYMEGKTGADEMQRLDLTIMGELHWRNEEERRKQDKARS